MKQINSMNVDELLTLKAKVEMAISARVEQERKQLTATLQRLDSIVGKTPVGLTSTRANGHGKRKKLSARYRNPSNPKETWAGRGNRPRWLVAALKGSKKKLSDFAIRS
jgi:DNA-binding protein H-NS